MATRTIKSPNGQNPNIAGIQFVNGSADVDDTTPQGSSLLAFARRNGWEFNGADGQPARTETVINGLPVAKWTKAQCATYLTENHVQFPANATVAQLRDVVLNAYEAKANGGPASPEGGAGHTSGTIPPEGAPPVSNPAKPDDPSITALYKTPLSTNEPNVIAPTFADQPDNVTKVQPAKATFSVVVNGTPTPEVQWERKVPGAESVFETIAGATGLSYETPATAVNQTGTQYRAIAKNGTTTVVSNAATLTVTAA